MGDSLSETDETLFQFLVRRIKGNVCTPFLGAGASTHRIKPAAAIAREWAAEFGYPLTDDTDLARVAQFRAIIADGLEPRRDMARICTTASLPDFGHPDEIYRILADLPFPIYLTTNYDDFIVRALRHVGKTPRREVCRWNRFLQRRIKSIFDSEPNYRPDPSNPLVFHLHGVADYTESMVITEDDYIHFLMWYAQESVNPVLIPSDVINALGSTSLLFLGYSRSDWSFRVVLRGVVGTLPATSRAMSVAVQLPLEEGKNEEERKRAQSYLESYFESIDQLKIRVYWSTTQAFLVRLKKHWPPE